MATQRGVSHVGTGRRFWVRLGSGQTRHVGNQAIISGPAGPGKKTWGDYSLGNVTMAGQIPLMMIIAASTAAAAGFCIIETLLSPAHYVVPSLR